jgi:hypothetical protein
LINNNYICVSWKYILLTSAEVKIENIGKRTTGISAVIANGIHSNTQ